MKVRGTDQKEHNLKPEQNLMKVRGTDHRKLNFKNQNKSNESKRYGPKGT